MIIHRLKLVRGVIKIAHAYHIEKQCQRSTPIRNQKLSITTKSCESRMGTADRIESLKRGSANPTLLDRAQRNPDNFVPSPASDPKIPNPRKQKEPQTGLNRCGIEVLQSIQERTPRPTPHPEDPRKTRSIPHGRDSLPSHGLHRSTLGDGGLNCRVRNGTG